MLISTQNRRGSKPAADRSRPDSTRLSEALQDTFERLATLPQLITLLRSLEAYAGIPPAAFKVLGAMTDPDYTDTAVAELVAQDPGLAARVLYLANTSPFARHRPVETVAEAVHVLGAHRTRSAVVASGLDGGLLLHGGTRSALAATSRSGHLIGLLAREVAAAETADPFLVTAAAVAGYLHDIGQVLVSRYLPASNALIAHVMMFDGKTRPEVEREVLGTDHGVLGGYLLWKSGCPTPVVAAVTWHAAPGDCPVGASIPLTAVHVAESLVLPPREAPPDTAYIVAAGLRRDRPSPAGYTA